MAMSFFLIKSNIQLVNVIRPNGFPSKMYGVPVLFLFLVLLLIRQIERRIASRREGLCFCENYQDKNEIITNY